MVRYFSADWVCPVAAPPIANGIVGMAADGTVTGVWAAASFDHQAHEVETHSGALVPGFVNTHCHLELSHLRGQFPMHTGLPAFVQLVMSQRDASPEAIESAMAQADQEMFDNGIVAVGDISNNLASKHTKEASKLYYHTFVETLGFHPQRAVDAFAGGLKLQQAFAPLPASVVPHAPYSVSEALFQLLKSHAIQTDAILSMHNQETADENRLFREKEGAFLELYNKMGLDLAFFSAPGKNSLPACIDYLPASQKQLLVHNTFTDAADYATAAAVHPNLYWCLCPSANRFIEDRLPDVALLQSFGARITLGTDSLASNTALNIAAEMKLLQDEKGIGLELLLQWATLNGAEFLGIDGYAGSLETGKKPGLNLVSVDKRGLLTSARVRRLV